MRVRDDISSYTVAVCGGAAVGKTSLIARLSKDVFLPPDKCPIAGLMTPVLVDLEDVRVRLMIWDTPSDDDYREMTVCHLAGAQLCILVFAFDNRESFDDAINVWNPIIEAYSKVPHITVAVGTKADLPEEEQRVKMEDIEKAGSEFGLCSFFVSAADGSGVAELREGMARQLAEAFPAKKEGERAREEAETPDATLVEVDGGCGCLLL
jgi:GTPase SAR1 family protein